MGSAVCAAVDMITFENVTKTYVNGDVATTVLKGITFEVKDGEFVAITGPSGSGKSTLMHIIGALDKPTTGKYFLDGKDVAQLPDEELATIRNEKIGFVFQAFNLLARATVVRNVMLPLLYDKVPRGERLAYAEKALEAAGLPRDRFYHLSNQLSGGQMQRVAIARALVNNPSIILADEPTGNLDSATGMVVMKTFQELNKAGHTIVLITHEADVAAYAQRTIHLRDGEIV